MKHSFPLLALVGASSLASAAMIPNAFVSASSLFSNNVGLSYHRQSFTGSSGHLTSYDVSATAFIGASDFLVQASSTVGGDLGTGQDSASLGYRFKNVGNVADVVLAVSSGDTYRIAAGRDIGNGFFFAVQASTAEREDQYGASLSYKVTKEISVDVNYVHATRDFGSSSNDLSAGIRYSF